MSVPLLDLKAQHATIRDDVVAAMMGVVDSQLFILGEPVARAGARGRVALARAHAIGCANGTDAILLALRALDVGRGDEVITTPFTFFATAGTIHNVGATPVFVDIEPDTFNILPAAVAAARRPATKAVIPVDLFGQMAPIESDRRRVPGLPIIEDAAQSIGARRMIDGEWRMAGEVPTIGTFSFFPSKNLGGYGDGGMLVTQDDALAERLKRLRVHGGAKQYFHDEVGYNSRLDALQAAVLAPSCRTSRAGARSAARTPRSTMRHSPTSHGRSARPSSRPENESIFNQYTIRVPRRRDELQAFLKDRGIGTSIYYPLPLHLQPCFAYLGYREGQCPESERAAQEVLSLPIFPELSDAQLDEVVAGVRAFFGR